MPEDSRGFSSDRARTGFQIEAKASGLQAQIKSDAQILGFEMKFVTACQNSTITRATHKASAPRPREIGDQKTHYWIRILSVRLPI
jgi:hypothetical protein